MQRPVMGSDFQFADLHCHPNLKTFGHSFDEVTPNAKQDLWYTERAGVLARLLKQYAGITRFSQCDLSSMARAGSKLAFVSLYPFEKGFFINAAGGGALSATLSDWITGIGYNRVRHIQRHTNYFEDLQKEYQFFLSGSRKRVVEGQEFRWAPISNKEGVDHTLNTPGEMGVVFSIEGAHVFNTGLGLYGRATDPKEVFENIDAVKSWKYPPVFITLAHNFNNDLCGHARSLDPLEPFVDQKNNLGLGFSPLGEEVVGKLLSPQGGCSILIDLKHMSLTSRKRYYEILAHHYPKATDIPIIVSHGAVVGTKFDGTESISGRRALFYDADINFYDEEILNIYRSGGLFALQLDSRRIASDASLKKISRKLNDKECTAQSAQIVWHQIQYVAELLDMHECFAWGTACIGSDFDGTINPLNGIQTVEDFPAMARELVQLADRYLSNSNPLRLKENREVNPRSVVENFCLGNAAGFLKKYFDKKG